jgi:hypothetical protein
MEENIVLSSRFLSKNTQKAFYIYNFKHKDYRSYFDVAAIFYKKEQQFRKRIPFNISIAGGCKRLRRYYGRARDNRNKG